MQITVVVGPIESFINTGILEPIYSSKKLFRARKKPHGLALYFSEIN
jgi:hypothetical protein